MTIEITWTITAIIAVSSFLSPIVVAIINNRHHAKMRKLELEHDECMRQLDLQQENIIRQFDIYYSDKKNAFSEFLTAAGMYSMDKDSSHSYRNIQATLQRALLFCNEETKILLLNFLDYADVVFGSSYTSHTLSEYSKSLSQVALALNKELVLTKPVIDCKKRK